MPVDTIFLQMHFHFCSKHSIKSAEKSDILKQQLIIIISNRKEVRQLSQHKNIRTASEEIQWTSRTYGAVIVLIAGLCLLCLGAFLSISLGAADIHLRTVWEAIFHYQPTKTSHQIIHDRSILYTWPFLTAFRFFQMELSKTPPSSPPDCHGPAKM